MDILLDNGFAWLMKVNVASMCGDYQTHYWGCACPLKWVHPAYDIDTIRDRGNFEKNGSIVLAMADSIEELQNKLLELCQDKWTNKSIRSDGQSDAAEIWTNEDESAEIERQIVEDACR